MDADVHLSKSVTISAHQWFKKARRKIVADVHDPDRY
jgi:ribosomal protein L18E